MVESTWGKIGRAAAWDRYFENGREGQRPQQLLRFSGGGPYVGVLVLLLAVWATVQSLRRKDSIFSLPQRKLLWFWLGISLISLLLAYGRFAPFYQALYALPYFSTIRNPVKFLNVVAFGVVVLFAYGVDGVWRRYLQPSEPAAAPRWAGLKAWWTKATRFERRWGYGCALALGISLLAWLAYASSRASLEQYLQSVEFTEAKAHAIAGFSIGQAGWFVLFFVVAAGLVILIMSGAFTGTRAMWGGLLLGLVLIADLGRANQPWVIYWDYRALYASNPIIDKLRDRPFEHRVVMLPFSTPPELSSLGNLYQRRWLKHLFPYYNVQSLEPFQMSRTPDDLAAFQNALITSYSGDFLRCNLRAWQLTNVRYLLGAAAFCATLNHSTDPAHPPFRVVEQFAVVPESEITLATNPQQLTAVRTTDGPYALLEFTEALPRAKLYSHWQIQTNDQEVLIQLGSTGFDPEQTVLVAGEVPPAPATAGRIANPGTVEFASYAPKDLVLKSDAPAPSGTCCSTTISTRTGGSGWTVNRPRCCVAITLCAGSIYYPARTRWSSALNRLSGRCISV